jgi:hypothetical protein
MSRLRGKSRKVFDVKELIGKVFRTKDLASAARLCPETPQFEGVLRQDGEFLGKIATSPRCPRTAQSAPISEALKIEGCCNPTPALNALITTTTIAGGSTSIPYGEDFFGASQESPARH